MRCLLVSRGFPPTGRWGSEHYTLVLARGLAASGIEVEALHPVRTAGPRGAIRTRMREGFRVHELAAPPHASKRLVHAYEDPELESAFEHVLDTTRPDLVHFNYLLWGLSARLPELCRARGIPSVLTLTDFGLLCHRGQMFDARLQPCGGPHPAARCASCIREPSRYDGSALEVFAKRYVGGALALAGGLGVVVTTADVQAREACMRRAMEALDHFIAPSAAFERVFLAAGVPREKLTRLLYAVDEEALAVARPEPRGPRVRIGYLGQFAPHKSPGTLLDAVEILEHRLPESVEPWDVLFYGEGVAGRHARYPAEVFGRVHSERVFVCRPFDPLDLPRVLAALHAVVVPSRWMENAPLTVLQARAAGVPIIASDVEGIREFVEPGVHGILFPPGNALALADALREVILRRLVRTPHPSAPMSLDEHLRQITALYARLVESRRPAVIA